MAQNYFPNIVNYFPDTGKREYIPDNGLAAFSHS